MESNQDLRPAAPAMQYPSPPPVRVEAGVFFGRFGLRAGWGIAIYLLIFAVLVTVITVCSLVATGQWKAAMAARSHSSKAEARSGSKHAPPQTEMKVKATVLNDGLTFICLAGTAWVLSRIERRRIGVYGIGGKRLRDLLPGAFWGLASLSILVGVLRVLHLLVFDGRLLSGAAIGLWGLKWLLAFLFVGLTEEYLLRGYLQYTLMRGFFGLAERISATNSRAVAFWMAAVLMSIVFAVLHLQNAGENHFGIFAVFLAGMVFSYALWRTGSLWWAIGFHMSWDWAQSFLYGVPDSGLLSVGRMFNTHPAGNPLLSGGIDGPEGSVFVVPTLLLVALVIRFTRTGVQPSLEPLDHRRTPEPPTAAELGIL